jgi:hypothetical protein
MLFPIAHFAAVDIWGKSFLIGQPENSGTETDLYGNCCVNREES